MNRDVLPAQNIPYFLVGGGAKSSMVGGLPAFFWVKAPLRAYARDSMRLVFLFEGLISQRWGSKAPLNQSRASLGSDWESFRVDAFSFVSLIGSTESITLSPPNFLNRGYLS